MAYETELLYFGLWLFSAVLTVTNHKLKFWIGFGAFLGSILTLYMFNNFVLFNEYLFIAFSFGLFVGGGLYNLIR